MGKLLASKFLITLLIVVIMGVAISQRLSTFSAESKDIYAYEKAIKDFTSGVNPYLWTVESYSNPNDLGNHGYAYLPGLLYTDTFLYLVSLVSGWDSHLLWKIPVLLADIGIGLFLIKELFNKNKIILFLGLLCWYFNPYFVRGTNYVFSDPLPIFFMLLALVKLEKDPVLSGVFYVLSIAFKTFPIILFPIFLFKTKDKKNFLLAAGLIWLAISLPFMGSVKNFVTYLNGAIFVHGNRFIQGRPFLYYISYFYKIEFFRIIPFKIYTYLANFVGWGLVSILFFKKWITDKYILAMIAFACFYTFTPVLNRTYLMWCVPILVIGIYRLTKEKTLVTSTLLSLFWLGYYWYLAQWKDGFHIWHP